MTHKASGSQDSCMLDMLPPQTSQSYNFDKILEIIWKRSSPHELYHYLSHTVGLKARLIALCTLLFPPKLLTKQSPPIEAETKEESGDSQKMKPSKKRLTVWKGSTKRRCKSQGARKNQETWGEPGQEGAREAQREKKERKLNIQLYEEEWDAFWRFCVVCSML